MLGEAGSLVFNKITTTIRNYPMKHFLALCIVALTALASQPAHAQLILGNKQQVHPITDVSLKSPKGEELYLGHLTATGYFLLGVYVDDKGYVLGIKGTEDLYYPMPEKPLMLAAQKTGLLPDPLPDYSIPPLEYIKGYSMWMLLAVFFVLSVMSKRKRRTRKTEEI